MQNRFQRVVFFLVSGVAIGSGALARAQQWSVPIEIASADLRAVQRYRDGTVHVLTRAVGVFGAPQLYHSWRPPGGVWAPRVAISVLGEPNSGAELPLFDGQQFFQLDDAGRAHVVFSKFVAGERRLWHTFFNPRLPQQGWRQPFAVTPPGGTPAAGGLQFDRQGDLHLIWTAIPGIGAAQVFHAQRVAGGAWGPATLLSTPGSPMAVASLCSHPASSFMIEAGGGLHVFFEQVPAGGGVAEVFHTRLRIGPIAAPWTPPVPVSGAGQPATAVATEVDGAGGLHLFWRAIPGLGTTQLWGARCAPGAVAWTGGRIISTPGTPNMGARVDPIRDFVAAGNAGDLHVVFDQVPGIGARQVFTQTYDLATGTWSGAMPATPAGIVHTAEGLLIDNDDSVHVLSRSGAPAQLFHSMRRPFGPFGPNLLISTPGAPNLGANLPWLRDETPMHLGPDGVVHVLFEQVPAALGPARVWHTSLDLRGAAVWTPPVDVSGAQNGAARIFEMHIDVRGEMHVVFGATPAVNTREQMFHARTREDGTWAPPEIVSTPGNPAFQARIPLVPWPVWLNDPPRFTVGYDFLASDELGSVDFVFAQQAAFGGGQRIFHTTLDRFALSVTTTGRGTGDLLARLTGVPAGTFEGFLFLSLDTNGPLGSGAFFGLEPDAITGNSLTVPPMPGNPLHWTWPAPAPLFPAAPFALPPGALPLPLGTAVDFLAVGLDPGGLTTSNVARAVF